MGYFKVSYFYTNDEEGTMYSMIIDEQSLPTYENNNPNDTGIEIFSIEPTYTICKMTPEEQMIQNLEELEELEEDEESEGPFGGAFRSWEEYYKYRGV